MKLTSTEVVTFLQQHPEFFDEHRALLANNFSENSQSVFYQKQLKVLKNREKLQQDKIDHIIDNVKNNQRLETDFTEIAMHLLSDCISHGHYNDHSKKSVMMVSKLIKKQFSLNAIKIILTTHETEKYHELKQRVIHNSSVCDDRVASELRQQIFGAAHTKITSCAFVPLLFQQQINGIMVLGSSDKSRYQPGVGVLFLNRLGLLLGSYFQAIHKKS